MSRGGAGTVEMPPDEEEGKEAGLGRILLLAKPEWGWIFVGLIGLFIGIVPMLLLPIYFGKVIDDIQAEGKSADERKELVADHLLQLMVILLIGAVASLFRAFIFNAGGERIVTRLRVRLFRAIVSQEIGMFDTRNTGELISRLTADTTALQDVATTNVSMFFRSITQILFSVVLMFYTSPELATLIVVIIPVIVIAVALYGRVIRRLSTEYTDALAESNNVAQQSVNNIRTVRSFAAEEVEIRKYERAVGDPDNVADRKFCWYPKRQSSYKAGVKRQYAGAFFQAFVTLVGLGAIVAVIWFGAYQVIDGKITEGSLFTFILYAVQIAGSVGMMAGLVASIFQAKGAAKRTFQLIDRLPKVPIKGGELPDDMKGDIRFDNVTFAYPTRPEVDVLQNFTLDIPKNETVAFVGHSGSGKSTVLSLIQRFYDVKSGRILIDGRPLTSLDPSWVRKNFAFVQQEPVLFGATVEANIAYGYAVRQGDPDAKPEQKMIEKAATDAFAHEFLSDKAQFPEGYQTVVGERGVRLSGGQKQRIAIARALLMDPRVLLLDEATSALDAESERYVTDAIELAMVGRTVLIVAHRLSTVQTADTIVVIDHGVIQDTGTHADLLKTCEKYEELVRRQLQAGEPARAPIAFTGSLTDSAIEPPASTEGATASVKMKPIAGNGEMKQPLLQS